MVGGRWDEEEDHGLEELEDQEELEEQKEQEKQEEHKEQENPEDRWARGAGPDRTQTTKADSNKTNLLYIPFRVP